MPRRGKRPKALPRKSLLRERKILKELISADRSRRVYTSVRTLFIDKFPQLYLQLQEEHPTVGASELTRLDKECMWLAGLLFNKSNLWAARDWRQPPILKFLWRAIRRARGGRPATKQQAAMQAKEMKLIDPKRWTWPKITAALCDCGREHDIRCQDNLRREVLHFEKALRALGCSF